MHCLGSYRRNCRSRDGSARDQVAVKSDGARCVAWREKDLDPPVVPEERDVRSEGNEEQHRAERRPRNVEVRREEREPERDGRRGEEGERVQQQRPQLERRRQKLGAPRGSHTSSNAIRRRPMKRTSMSTARMLAVGHAGARLPGDAICR